MLTSMRKGVSSLLAKALLLFLVLTFSVWGIGDALRGGTTSYIAKIGAVTITPDVFQTRLQRIVRSIPNITSELAHSEQLKRQVLQGMIQQALLTQEANRLGLQLDKKTIALLISKEPAFHDAKGRFDPQLFRSFLDNNNISEHSYIESLSRDTLSTLLLNTLGLHPDFSFASLANNLDAAAAQSRSSEAWIIKANTLAQPNAPDSKTLAAFYEQNKNQYLTEETRSIDYISLSISAIREKLNATISEDELKERYAIEKASLTKPETRSFLLWLFKDEASAQNAQSLIESGKSPKNARESALKDITQDSLPKDMATIMFALKSAEVSAPIKTDFGWQIGKVTHIKKAHIPDYASSKTSIRDIIVSERLDEEINALSGQLEDALSAGDSLKKAAKATPYNASFGSFDAVTRHHQTNNPVEAYALNRGFALQEGESSGLEANKDNQLIAVWVKSISPSAPKPLSDIEQALRADYIKKTHAQNVAKKAYDIYAKLETSENASTIAEKERIVITQLPPITLREALEKKESTSSIPLSLYATLFETELGKFTAPQVNNDGDWVMLKVKQIAQSLPKSSARKESLENTNAALENDIYNYYLLSLQKRYPVTVNNDLITPTETQK